MIDFGAALVARAVAPRTILELLHTVERRRQAASAPPWALHVDYATYTRRVYRSQPVPQRSPAQEPISIARLVSELPSDNSFASLRLRALLLLRCTSMLRPGEPWTISRRSLHVFQPPGLSPPRVHGSSWVLRIAPSRASRRIARWTRIMSSFCRPVQRCRSSSVRRGSC